MSKRRFVLSDVSWFQVVGSALAAVTAAWIASQLGVAGTLVGAALGSFIVTLSSAFYTKTLDRGRTLLIQTERGTVIERHVEEGEVTEAFDEAKEVDGPVVGAQFVDDEPRLHWKTIFATTLIVLAIAMAGITTYELITRHPLGHSGGGTTLGDTFGGGSKDKPETPTPSKSTTTPPPATRTTTRTAPTTPPAATGSTPPTTTPSVSPATTTAPTATTTTPPQ